MQKACDRLSCVCTFKHWQNGGRPKAQVTPHMPSEKILWDIESERLNRLWTKLCWSSPLWKELISIEKEGNSVGVCCVCLNSKSRHESRHCPIKSFWLFLTGAKRMWPAFLCLHLQKLAKWWKTKSASHSAYSKRYWTWKAESTLDKIVLVQPLWKELKRGKISIGVCCVCLNSNVQRVWEMFRTLQSPDHLPFAPDTPVLALLTNQPRFGKRLACALRYERDWVATVWFQ